MQRPVGNSSPYQCPRCKKMIQRGEHVVLDAADLIHVACLEGEAVDLVATFLRRHAPKPYCHICLSSSTNLAYETVRKAVAVLRMSPEFPVAVDQACAKCENQRVTVVHSPHREGI